MTYSYHVVMFWVCVSLLPGWLACAQPERTIADNTKSMKKLEIGDPMPQFALQDHNGDMFDTKDYVGKQALVVYFYPKDDSPGCTKQACAVRDQFEEFTAANAAVIGINSGSVESHLAFREKHNLPFTLLSDPGNVVSRAFGVRNFLFLTGRETFVIGLDGKVAYTFKGMFKDEEHVQGALAFLQGSGQ